VVAAKNIGITGVLAPVKSCNDANCPYHGYLKVRGIILESKVYQMRSKNMVVVEREYTFYNKKYQRYERRRSRIHAHLPPCVDVNIGDVVLIGESRPIAKSVSFVVLGRRL
jgi:small subunit ribosomal protein S17